MLKRIKENKVLILWLSSLVIMISSIIIAQFRPFGEKGSGIIIWISFNLALLGMIFSTLRNKNRKNKYRIALYVFAMITITVNVVLRFL